MTKTQLSYHAMMNATMNVLNDNQSVWAGMKPIADEVATVKPLLAVISAEAQSQYDHQTNGHTNQKGQAMDAMNSLGYKMALKVAAWARKAGNEVVLKATSHSKSDIERGAQAEQINRNTAIANFAKENMAALADYKVSAENIAALQAAIAAATPLAAVRDAVGSNRQAATGSIASTIKKANDIFIHLDHLVEGLVEADDEAFEDAYFAARKVIHRKGGGVKQASPVVAQ